MLSDSLRQRSDFVIEYMKLGMDFSTACVAAECSPEMVEAMENDEEFIQRKKFALAKLEAELLQRLSDASSVAALKGDTRSTERMLEIIRPDRYAKTAKVTHSIDSTETPKEVKISFVSSVADEEEEPDLVSAEG
jgi:hypothetical protein